MDDQTAVDLGKGAPPAAVVVAHAVGFTVPDLISSLTILYLSIVIIQILYKGVRALRSWRK